MASDIRDQVLLAIRDHIAKNGPDAPLTMKEIATAVETNQHNVVYHVKQLVKKGLLTTDRRNNDGAVYRLSADLQLPPAAPAQTAHILPFPVPASPPPADVREDDPVPQEAQASEVSTPKPAQEVTVPEPAAVANAPSAAPPPVEPTPTAAVAPAAQPAPAPPAQAEEPEDDEPLQYCTQCGRKVRPTWRFCGRCGGKLI